MSSIGNFILNNIARVFVYSVLVISVLGIVNITFRMGYVMGIAVSILPMIVVIFLALIYNPFLGFTMLFVTNYYMSGLARYFANISTGIYVDVILGVIFLALVINSFFNKSSNIKFSNAFNRLTLVAFIWFLFCSAQILNPNSASILAWLQSARGIGVYFIIVVSLSAIVLRRFVDLKRILFIWALLSLTAVLKAYIQKTFGFDSAELRWLLEGGGSRTHFINTGIRYFSFYTDAANFGTGIAFAGTVFAISSYYFKKMKMKIFYLFTAAVCGYGMMISGTRGSLAVPFVALLTFVFLSKNVKAMIISVIIVATSFVILRYTDFGHWNTYMRRMRTAFDPEDASFKVRQENQQKLRTYMLTKPFGAGIGMSRKRSVNYTPDPFLSKIPTDSWYVLIWVETGIVGLILHLLILLYIIFHGAYLVLFRLKNSELKGLITALICGIAGVYVASYSIEIIGQFPTGFIFYISMTLVFISPVYDKELEEIKLQKQKTNEQIS